MDFDRAMRYLNEAHQELIRERDGLRSKLEFVCDKEREARKELSKSKHSEDFYKKRWKRLDGECQGLKCEVESLKRAASHQSPSEDKCEKLAVYRDRTRAQIDALKHEVVCEECKGGVYAKHCPECKSQSTSGDRCDNCGTITTACPTCGGSGLKYFPIAAVKGPEPAMIPAGAMEIINRAAQERLSDQVELIDGEIRRWLAGGPGRRLEDLYVVHKTNGRVEVRVISSGETILRIPSPYQESPTDTGDDT